MPTMPWGGRGSRLDVIDFVVVGKAHPTLKFINNGRLSRGVQPVFRNTDFQPPATCRMRCHAAKCLPVAIRDARVARIIRRVGTGRRSFHKINSK